MRYVIFEWPFRGPKFKGSFKEDVREKCRLTPSPLCRHLYGFLPPPPKSLYEWPLSNFLDVFLWMTLWRDALQNEFTRSLAQNFKIQIGDHNQNFRQRKFLNIINPKCSLFSSAFKLKFFLKNISRDYENCRKNILIS